MYLRANQPVARRFIRAAQNANMHLVAARQALGEPQQRRNHSLGAAPIKAARHNQNDLHVSSPKWPALLTLRSEWTSYIRGSSIVVRIVSIKAAAPL
jgi:hypothetical protein